MNNQFKKTLFRTPFGSFMEELTIELYREGFVILASSDVRKVLKDSLRVNIKGYEILSVIIPHLFHEMLSLQPFTGMVVPCQVIVRETADRGVEVVISDPARAAAGTVDDPTLQNIALEISRRLEAVMGALSDKPVGVPDGLV